MVRLLLHTSLLISLLLATGLPAKAQTCRVNIGSNASGAQSYMEVYEYDYVTDKPSFPGGDRNLMTFINATRNYPLDAYRKGIQGRVTCSFVVNTDGSVRHPAEWTASPFRSVWYGRYRSANNPTSHYKKQKKDTLPGASSFLL